MLTLAQAIAALTKATDYKKSSPQQFRIGRGRISTTNGTISAVAPFAGEFPEEPLVVDVEALKRVWTDTAKAKIDNGQLVVRDRRSTYKLRIVDDMLMMPDIRDEGEQLTVKSRDAIVMASDYAAKAGDAWLCSVTVRDRRAIATNRVVALSAECDLDTDVVLPPWALKAFRADGHPPKLSADRTGVTLIYDDGLMVHSAPVAALPPEALFRLVPDAPAQMVSLQPLLDVRDDALRLEGRSILLDPGAGSLTVTMETEGDASVTEVDLGGEGAPFRVQDLAFRMMLKHATHVSFEKSPDKIQFAVVKDGVTTAHGILAGQRA